MGGLWRSLQIAKSAAHLPASRPVEIEEGPAIGTFDLSALRPRLLGAGTGEIEPGHAAAGLAPPGLAGLLSEDERNFLRRLIRARGRPILMMEPIEIEPGAPRP